MRWTHAIDRPQRWWARYDSSTDHSIRRASDPPGPEWVGGFRTFTEARDHLTAAGAREAAAIVRRNRWWREASKAEILRLTADD